MDYAEEQSTEIEALQAILDENISAFDGTKPEGWPTGLTLYCLSVAPSEDVAVQPDSIPLRAELVFAHTATYPDEAPLVKARSVQGLGDADAAALQSVTDAAVVDNLGMPMMYALFAVAQDWLSDKATAGVEIEVDPLVAKKAAEEAEEQRLAELRRLGTPVTPETFAPWKQRFYVDLVAAAAQNRAQQADETKGKLTGKAFFLAADSRSARQGDDLQIESEGSEDDDTDYEDDSDDGMLEELDGRHAVVGVTV